RVRDLLGRQPDRRRGTALAVVPAQPPDSGRPPRPQQQRGEDEGDEPGTHECTCGATARARTHRQRTQPRAVRPTPTTALAIVTGLCPYTSHGVRPKA